jgi:hypothetical protein
MKKCIALIRRKVVVINNVVEGRGLKPLSSFAYCLRNVSLAPYFVS